jgi:hypothetical protein
MTATMSSLIFKRAAASRTSGEWREHDYDAVADGIVVGRIVRVTRLGHAPGVRVGTIKRCATARSRARDQGRSLSARGLLRSHREHRRADGLARLQVSMRLRGLFQRIGLLDLDLDRAREHHPEEILCHRREIGTGGSVGV